MKRIMGIGCVGAGALLVLLLVAAVGALLAIRRPFPQTEGRVSLNGLTDEVSIIRDEWGIPHIYASNEADLFFAQGYVHAQDRFWQMEFWRHIGQGRISEIAGAATIEQDRFIRTMGWNRMAAESLAYYAEEAPEFMRILEAYAAGVNAYIEQQGDSGAQGLSINRTILSLVNEPWEIEPWEPLDTLSWAIVMSNTLSGNWSEELERARLIGELGEATVGNLMLPYPYDRRPVIVSDEAMRGEANEEARVTGQHSAAIDWSRVDTELAGEIPPGGFAFGQGPFLGSNNWVVSGEHTASGLPLLANDPHLGIQLPSIWYEVALHAPGYDVSGFSFAGAPGIIIGHNDRIAWGVTNLGPDVQDLYIERINPNNPRQYEFRGEWRDMEVVEEVIKVNGGEDVVLEVFVTHHGPIINGVVEDARQDKLAMRWTAAEPTRVLQSVVLLNKARNYEEFREALRYWDLPAQNFVYAGVEGNIAYQMPGRVPIRQNGNGLVPVPGWTGEYEWQGWIPYEELPALFNPEQGYIVTANNAVVEPDYPYLIAMDWAPGERAQRITDLLEEAIARGNVTADDFARIQLDNYSLLAEQYVPLFAGLSSDDPQIQAALERLRGWGDYQVRRESVPAALFEIFLIRLEEALLADEIGMENIDSVHGAEMVILFNALAEQPDAVWWDNINTERTETREEILLQALSETVDWFETKVGGDMNEWRWGAIHTGTFVSAPLGQSGIAPIEALVNRGPYPVDGTSTALNATGWNRNNPAAVTGHPSMRMIVDLANFDASRAIHPTGQSGHPFHPHYDDMISLWLNGEYHRMWFSEDAVQAAGEEMLVLTPGGSEE